jgi:hypothetical protein
MTLLAATVNSWYGYSMEEKPVFPEDLRAYFRACAARRRRVDTACATCGTALPNVVLKRRYCGPTCRKRAQLQRRRAEQAD